MRGIFRRRDSDAQNRRRRWGPSFFSSSSSSASSSSSLSLRTLLFLNFGVAAAVSLLLVVLVSCGAAFWAGRTVQYRSDHELLRKQVTEHLVDSSAQVAETVTAYLSAMKGSTDILVQVVQERFMGYPTMEGWEDDKYVPFVLPKRFHNQTGEKRQYPITVPPPPLDWNITSNINILNAFEHLQLRATWLLKRVPQANGKPLRPSTASASFHMQGTCDPLVTDESSPVYYPNCTAINNDVTRGGNVQPTSVHQHLYAKSGDLTFLLKALFEIHPKMTSVGIQYFNGGAGASVTFPAKILDGSQPPYISDGCEWMLENINPFTNLPFGTREEADRCHPKGTLVPWREFNPMETGWCPRFALDGGATEWHGPYFYNGIPMLAMGQGIFDKLTGHFIGCAFLSVSLADLSKLLSLSILGNHSVTSLVGLDGHIGSSTSDGSIRLNNEPILIWETGILDEESFKAMRDTFVDPSNLVNRTEMVKVVPSVGNSNFSLATAYPIPVPHESHHSEYQLKGLVVHAIGKDVFEAVEQIENAIHADFLVLARFLIGMGLMGMLVVLVVVWLVSHVLTRPLLWMERVAWSIVNHTVSNTTLPLLSYHPVQMKFAPHTEVDELVAEFQKMIKGFSGRGASKVADSSIHEIKNEMNWHSDFSRFYSAGRKSFGPDPAMVREVSQLMEEDEATKCNTTNGHDGEGSLIVLAPRKVNRYSNIRQQASPTDQFYEVLEKGTEENQHRSFLFLWIMLLLVIPLLLVNIVTCYIVVDSVVAKIPAWVSLAEDASYDLEVESLVTMAKSKSARFTTQMLHPSRDLHVIRRLAEWVLFGAIDLRSDGIMSGSSHSDALKQEYQIPVLGSKIVERSELSTWNDANETFDAMDRNDDIIIDGYRLQVVLALGIVSRPVWSYPSFLWRKSPNVGSYFIFDDDGRSIAIPGRKNSISEVECVFNRIPNNWRSCKGWCNETAAESDLISFSVPYQCDYDGGVCMSAATTIQNPSSGECIGQAAIEFAIPELRRALGGSVRAPLLLLMTKQHNGGLDVAFDLSTTLDWFSARAMTHLLFRNESNQTSYVDAFEKEVLLEMESGSRGTKAFYRTGEDGQTEKVVIAFNPIYRRLVKPISPNDFSRGISASFEVSRSLGVARVEKYLRQPFHRIEQQIQSDLGRIGSTYTWLIGLISLAFIVVVGRISVYVTTPIIKLLFVVRAINSGKLDDDDNIPPLTVGAREISRVYASFTKLCKVIRMSNTAFFSGNFKMAYRFQNDALKLFRKIEDQKAIGIASNNIGNTLFAICRESKDGMRCLRIKNEDECGVAIALQRYNESVKIGEIELQEAVGELEKANFIQQLADRYFNRGLFLLLVGGGDACSPNNARDLAYKDIRTARVLDADVRGFWLDRKLLLKNSDRYFCRLLRRIDGLSNFDNDLGLRKVWDVTSIIEAADQLLAAAWDEQAAPLFREVSRIGRLQQLEGAAIRLALQRRDIDEAATIAFRMLIEDSFLLETPFVSAGTAIMSLSRSSKDVPLQPKAVSSLRSDFRQMAKACKHISLDVGKSVVFCLELSHRWRKDVLLRNINRHCLRLYDRYCTSGDLVGVAAYKSDKNLTLKPSEKALYYELLRARLDDATTSTSDEEAFQIAAQMVLEADSSLENDTFILLISDGESARLNETEYKTVVRHLREFGRDRSTSIHVLIIGVSVESDAVRQKFRLICNGVSKSSMYLDANKDTIEGAFERVTTRIMGRKVSNSNHFLRGTTMEKF